LLRQITPNIYHGNMEDAIAISKLQNTDINFILYLGQELPHELSHNSLHPVIHIPLKDGYNDELRILTALHNIIITSLEYKILVACRGGLSRSPALIVAYTVIKNKKRFPLKDYLPSLKEKIPGMLINQDLLDSVEKTLKLFKVE